MLGLLVLLSDVQDPTIHPVRTVLPNVCESSLVGRIIPAIERRNADMNSSELIRHAPCPLRLTEDTGQRCRVK